MSSESVAKIKIGSDPVNWWDATYITLPKEFAPTPQQILGQMHELGYDGCTFGAPFPDNPEELWPLLDEYNMEINAGFFLMLLLSEPLEIEISQFEKYVRLLKALNASVVFVTEGTYNISTNINKSLYPYRLPYLTADEWKKLAYGIQELTKIATSYGLKFGYHPMVSTVVQQLWQIERLLEACPDLNLVIDTGHLALAGINPLYVVDKYSDIAILYHLKNVRPYVVNRVMNESYPWSWAVIDGAFTVPGDGGIDFVPILEKIEASGFEGWVTLEAEQNSLTSNPYLYANLGRQYIASHTNWGGKIAPELPPIDRELLAHRYRHIR